jgi:ABC-2 type transport system permease protein
MNRALFVSTFKTTYQLLVICTAAMVLYAVAIISMFNPNDTQASQKLLESMPAGFSKAFGMQMIAPDLTPFLGTTMYLPYMLFMIIFVVITANNIIARRVDRGSMACYLSTPVSRVQVTLTQAGVLILGQFMMAFVLTVVSILISTSMFGSGSLDIGAFSRLNLMGLCLFLLMGAFSFLFSCLFNEEKYSLACSTGLIVLFYAINAIGNLNGEHSWLNKISIFGAFNPAKIISGSVDILVPAISFILVGIILYGIAIFVFNKRNLPL